MSSSRNSLLRMHLLTMTSLDGLTFKASWWGVKGSFAGRISGELVIDAQWGEDGHWRKSLPLYLESCDLDRKARAAITQFEREIRAGTLDG